MPNKVGCIIQARLSSSRFPRKILAPINGKPILEHLVERVHMVKEIDQVILAVPHSPECCLNEEIFIGSESDVLDRYYQAAKKFELSTIVRVTSDCPIVPPFEIARCVRAFLKANTDYLTNIGFRGKFGTPDGWDVEVFSFKALENAWKYATLPEDREHVTSYIRRDCETQIYLGPPKLSIDTEEDLKRVTEYLWMEPHKTYDTMTTLGEL